jgi:hypothetical protein
MNDSKLQRAVSIFKDIQEEYLILLKFAYFALWCVYTANLHLSCCILAPIDQIYYVIYK